MAQPGTQLHGPGGLLATPGLGTGRKRRWGQRFKAKQIVGNLFRGNDGKFQAGGGGSSAKPADRKARSEARRTSRQERSDARAASRDAAVAAEDDTRADEDAYIAGGKTARERAKRRQKVTADRRARAQERREAQRAAMAEERATRQSEDAAERATQAQDAAQKPAAGGGGGGKPTPSDEDTQRAQANKRQETARDTGQAAGWGADMVNALRMQAEGGKLATPRLDALGLTANGEATDAGRRAHAALQRGDRVGFEAALQDARSAQGRATARTARDQEREQARRVRDQERAQRDAARTEEMRTRLDEDDALAALPDPHARRQGQQIVQQRRRTRRRASLKALTVFKDHTGAHRWIARTTTAYRDRDGEIIASAALDADSQRMTAMQQFGPLRYWHVGQPDPLSASEPWGPGLDIGDCDYSVLIGRTRMESGTFRDPVVAARIARQASEYELSPGFFHPLDQPAAGVFSAIRTFERSLVPMQHGRAANLFTGLSVKEHRMDPDEMERRFKAAITDLGLSATQAQALGQQLIATEKAASAQGVAFKTESAPAELVINGVTYTVKAAPPPAEGPPAPPAEAKAEGDLVVDEEMVDEEMVEDEPGGPFVGDMTPDEFFAKLAELLAPVLKMQDMVKSIGDMTGELKSMYGGVATKEASTSAAIVALAQQVAVLAGNQPNTVLPDEVAAALKSAGPTAPDAPDHKPIESTPERPWAGWAARSFPELYQPDPA